MRSQDVDGAMQTLSRTDAGFLAAEKPAWQMSVGLLAIFDVAGAANLGPEAVRDLVTGRLARLALFRRRVVETPGRLGRPVWEDIARLDVDAHLHHATVEPPGGRRQLDRAVGDVFERPLDRRRPLWELWRLEGLEDGGVALLLKIHHACIDGLHAAEFATLLFDVVADAPRELPAVPPAVERATALARVGETARSVATTPFRAARVVGDVLGAAPRLARFAMSRDGSASLLPFEAPAGPFNGPLTPQRRFAFCSVPLADVQTVKRAFGVSVNDVVLAMCSGALREYLMARDALPARTMVAQIPMGIRRDGRHVDPGTVPGNLLSAMGAALPVHLDGPADRLRAVGASTQAARALHHALGDDLLADLVAVPPPAVLSWLARAYGHLGLEARLPPIFNAIVSNVPGPPVPLYCCGARLAHAHLLGPLIVGGGLNVTVLSYLDWIDVGIVSCPDVVDDAWEIADAMPDALAELVDASAHA